MKILHIDDNQEITDMFSDLLPSLGFEYTGINDPRKGIEQIKEEKHDVIVLDVHMPPFNGLNIIQMLENENILKKQKIIMLSGAELTPNQTNELLKKGVHRCLKKPISFNNFLTAITG